MQVLSKHWQWYNTYCIVHRRGPVPGLWQSLSITSLLEDCWWWNFPALLTSLPCCPADASAHSAVNARKHFTLQGLSNRRSLPAGNTSSLTQASLSAPSSSLWPLSFHLISIYHIIVLNSIFFVLIVFNVIVYLCTLENKGYKVSWTIHILLIWLNGK